MESFISSKKSNTWLKGIVFALFCMGLGCYQFLYHEFWKDEWQAWFIATDTPSLGSLFHLLSAEGHPALWFLLLRFSHWIASGILPHLPPEYLIQSVHLLITCISFWFLFYRFRFPVLLSLCFAGSYFLLFEYGVINRGYSLVILLLFALGSELNRPGSKPLTLGILLFLLTQTEVYGLFAALSISLYYILCSWKKSGKLFSKEVWMISGSMLLGAVLFIGSMLPAHTGTEHGSWAMAFVSLYANTWCIGIVPPQKELSTGAFLLSLLLLGLVIFILRKNSPLLLTFLLFSGSFWIFTSLFYHGGPRQWGLHFVFLLFVIQFVWPTRNNRSTYAAFLLLFILVIPAQLIYAFRIMEKERLFLFSNSRNAGKYIRNHIPPETPVIGINKAYCTPVIGYSGHRFFSLPGGELYSYAIFQERMFLPSQSDILNFYDQHGKKELYIVSWMELPSGQFPRLELVEAFNKPSIREEEYFLYQVKREKTGS